MELSVLKVGGGALLFSQGWLFADVPHIERINEINIVKYYCISTALLP